MSNQDVQKAFDAVQKQLDSRLEHTTQLMEVLKNMSNTGGFLQTELQYVQDTIAADLTALAIHTDALQKQKQMFEVGVLYLESMLASRLKLIKDSQAVLAEHPAILSALADSQGSIEAQVYTLREEVLQWTRNMK